MRLPKSKLWLLYGVLFTLAALPVFGQESESNAPKIDRQALRTFGDNLQRKVESGEVDLKASFLLELTASLTKAGKIDPATVKYLREEGDPKMIGIAKEAIEAVNDSGFFPYLSSLGSQDMGVVLEQNLTELTALVSLGVETEARAKAAGSGLKTFLMMAKTVTPQGPDIKQGDKDAMLFLNSAHVKAEGKTVLVSMKVSKVDFHEMIGRHLLKHTTVPGDK